MKKFFFACALAGSALAFAIHAWAAAPSTPVGNVNYQILNTDVRLIPIVALTTNRTWTLPYAGSMGTSSILIQDAQGNVGGANSCILVTAQSGDTINGVASQTLTFCSTYGRLTFTPVSGTNWVVSDNGSQLVSASINLTNAKQITTNSSITLASVSLPPGDWDCRGTAAEQLSATTTVTKLSASLVTTDGVLGTQGTDGTTTVVPASAISTSGVDLKLGPSRFAVASTTTVFLVEGATFATSQLWGYGTIACRGQD
jgi:hypothetical protein